jgi:acetyl-CoA synthetase
VHDVVLMERLPRTASNKIMRRVLRDQYVRESERRGG